MTVTKPAQKLRTCLPSSRIGDVLMLDTTMYSHIPFRNLSRGNHQLPVISPDLADMSIHEGRHILNRPAAFRNKFRSQMPDMDHFWPDIQF